jgi:hypothetical protein
MVAQGQQIKPSHLGRGSEFNEMGNGELFVGKLKAYEARAPGISPGISSIVDGRSAATGPSCRSFARRSWPAYP